MADNNQEQLVENSSQDDEQHVALNMKRFEVRTRPAKGGGLENAVFIGGELLDWTIDLNSMMEAAKMGPQYVYEVKRDIERHFADSVSDFLGRKVTIEEVQKATKTGWI